MKRMVSLIFLISIISSSAQELNEKDFPTSGSNGLYRSFPNFVVKDPADRAGKDVEWDYSTFPSSQGLQPVYWAPIELASDEEKAIYNDATYFVEDNTSDRPINFFKIDGNTHKYLGFNFSGQSFKFESPVDYFTYPMTFEQSLETDFQFEDESFGSGIFTVTYDAYGSIKIPELEFDDVYRLKLETKTVFPDTPDDTITSREYHYYERGTGQLLLRLNELGPSDTEGRLNYSYIYFVEKETSINPELTVNTIVYPNPTQSELIFVIPNHEIKSYEIYNNLGNIVAQGEYNNFINVVGLATGNYFIKAKLDNDEYIMKKFIKE